ncbi:hypothetical protein [Actinoplanes xinjiangensis]|uniref:hypothetical protein n=1 Tax=Actinoplanes xinjiangensis TaxID=512350 RepID=UPI00344ACD0E
MVQVDAHLGEGFGEQLGHVYLRDADLLMDEVAVESSLTIFCSRSFRLASAGPSVMRARPVVSRCLRCRGLSTVKTKSWLMVF